MAETSFFSSLITSKKTSYGFPEGNLRINTCHTGNLELQQFRVNKRLEALFKAVDSVAKLSKQYVKKS